jgi:hypothetical protein
MISLGDRAYIPMQIELLKLSKEHLRFTDLNYSGFHTDSHHLPLLVQPKKQNLGHLRIIKVIVAHHN